MGIEPFMLASSLRMVAAQRLVRVLCASCRKPYKPTPEEFDKAVKGAMTDKPPDYSQAVFYKAVGCPKCAKTGYLGRKAIYEVYFIDSAMQEAIYKHSGDIHLMKAVAAKSGMWNLRASGWRKVLQGVTTPEEVLAVTVLE